MHFEIKNGKLHVSIEFIADIQEKRKIINQSKPEDTIFYINGEIINIPKDIIDRFKVTGLANIDFIEYLKFKKILPKTSNKEENES